MLRKAEVPVMMTRVELALSRSESEGGAPLHFISPEGDDADLSYLRRAATVSLDFHSGSARPVVGRVIVALKHRLRQGLRWYLAPIVEQQSRFNHAALDLIEKARLENQQLRARIAALEAEGEHGPE